MSYSIRALENFVAVAKVGGFAKAARELNISQPSLSRSIAQLETSLGAQLFARGRSGTQITDKGRKFLPFANSILLEVQRAQNVFEDEEYGALDRIVLSVSPTLLHEGLPRVIRVALENQPQLGLEIHTGTLETLLEGIRLCDVNVAVAYMADIYKRQVSDLKGLAVEELSTRELIPIARADHPIFQKNYDLVTASKYEWAVPHQMSVSYRFETAFFRRDIAIPRQRLNCTSIFLMKRAIIDCGLIGMLPSSLVSEELAEGVLRIVDIPELYFRYSLVLITLKDVPLTPGVKALTQILWEVFGEKTERHAPVEKGIVCQKHDCFDDVL